MQLHGREYEMNRAAAVYLHGISAFKHKHENNTIKLHGWAICYYKQRPTSRSLGLSHFSVCLKRVKDRRSPLPLSPLLPTFVFISAPATLLSLAVRWCMSDLQWWICHLLPSGSLTASMIHMTSLPLTLLGAGPRGWQPRAEGNRARPDKGFSKSAWTTMVALPPSISSPLPSVPLFSSFSLYDYWWRGVGPLLSLTPHLILTVIVLKYNNWRWEDSWVCYHVWLKLAEHSVFPIVLWDEPETPSTDLIYYLHSTTEIPINKLTAIPDNFSTVTNKRNTFTGFLAPRHSGIFWSSEQLFEKGFTMPNKYVVDEGGKSSWHTCSHFQTQITEGEKSKDSPGNWWTHVQAHTWDWWQSLVLYWR